MHGMQRPYGINGRKTQKKTRNDPIWAVFSCQSLTCSFQILNIFKPRYVLNILLSVQAMQQGVGVAEAGLLGATKLLDSAIEGTSTFGEESLQAGKGTRTENISIFGKRKYFRCGGYQCSRRQLPGWQEEVRLLSCGKTDISVRHFSKLKYTLQHLETNIIFGVSNL